MFACQRNGSRVCDLKTRDLDVPEVLKVLLQAREGLFFGSPFLGEPDELGAQPAALLESLCRTASNSGSLLQLHGGNQ